MHGSGTLDLSLISVPFVGIAQASQLNVTLGGADRVVLQDSSQVTVQFQATDGIRINSVDVTNCSSVSIQSRSHLGYISIADNPTVPFATGINVSSIGSLQGLSSIASMAVLNVNAASIQGSVSVVSNSSTRPSTTNTLTVLSHGSINGDVLIYGISNASLSTYSIQGSLTIYHSPTAIALTAFSNHIQGSLNVTSYACADVSLQATTVEGNVSWTCSDTLTLPLVDIRGSLTVNARSVNADLLHRVTGNITSSNANWPLWSSASLNAVGGLVFHGRSDSQTLLSLPMLSQAGVLDFQVQGPAQINLAAQLVVGDLSVVLNSGHLSIFGTINATGTVLISMLDSTDVLDWNLIQGGDTTICDVIQTDASLDTLESVHNLTLGGCRDESQPISPQNLRSLSVILGTLRADMTNMSGYDFTMPGFPSLRSITQGLCFTSRSSVSVDLSPLLKASVSGTCYVQETIHLTSACPCSEGCQHVTNTSCF